MEIFLPLRGGSDSGQTALASGANASYQPPNRLGKPLRQGQPPAHVQA